MPADYKKGPLPWFNAKGEHTMVHNPQEELNAKALGFTSAVYVRSEYPQTWYQLKTGATIAVKSRADKDALGDDWTDQFVPVPEAAKPAVGATAAEPLLRALMSEVADLSRRLGMLEAAPEADAAAIRKIVKAELEELLAEPAGGKKK